MRIGVHSQRGRTLQNSGGISGRPAVESFARRGTAPPWGSAQPSTSGSEAGPRPIIPADGFISGPTILAPEVTISGSGDGLHLHAAATPCCNPLIHLLLCLRVPRGASMPSCFVCLLPPVRTARGFPGHPGCRSKEEERRRHDRRQSPCVPGDTE